MSERNPYELKVTETPRVIQNDLIDNNCRVFYLAARDNWDLVDFINKFMRSEVAELFDQYLNKYRWDGGDGMYAEFLGECDVYGIDIEKNKSKYSKYYRIEAAHWIGYIYRLTHFKTGESSKEIVEFMPPDYMLNAYAVGHTWDPDFWIENFYWDNDLDRFYKYFDDLYDQAQKEKAQKEKAQKELKEKDKQP